MATDSQSNPDPDLAALPLASIKKYRPLNEMVAERQALAERGVRVVFSNGCFDLLHVGHVRYLAASKRLGDVLIVGINSDESTRSIKGPDRPIRTAALRAELLAELACVDYVTIFEEPSVTPALLKIRPDIYTKGGDYTLETIDAGLREAILKHDIRIEFPAHVPGASTTELLRKTLGEGDSDFTSS